ncbi:putative ribonuclease H-like domain-containing protein [Tanacetum coccineum]
MSTLTFADTHNMVAFLDKPAESDGFHEIIDFLNANQISYALTVNLIIYTSCIQQFWAMTKANTVNGERQLQALIDKKKVIITESSIRSDLHLEDAGGTDCLPTATLFEELARMGWRVYPRFLQVFINQPLGDMSHHKKIYVNPSHTKKIFANMRREGKGFSGRITPLFETMMVQPTQNKGVDSGIPTDSNQIPIATQPSSSRSQKKQSRRKQRKDTTVTQEETQQDDSVPTPSNDPPISVEDSMKLSELMILCTNLQKHVLDLEMAKDAQAKEIADLKKRVQKLERQKKSRTTGLKRLRKVGMSGRVESPEDKDSLGDHEDASKQGRSIEDIDKDANVSLVDDTQGRSDDVDMFDTNDLHGDEVNVDMPVGEKQEQSAKEREVDTSVEDSTAPTTIEEITLAQTLIQIKVAKPKVVTTTATTTTTTRPKARGVVVQEPSEFRTPQESQPSMIKDKGKAIMIEPEVPLKRKDQVALDEDLARNLQAQLEAELIEEERLARKKEEEANIALIESWDNTQAMMEADFELAQRLQTEEQGEITIEERSRLFVELMNKRKKHFAMLRAEEKRRKPPTKAQKRNQMSTYLKNMGGYKHNQLKSKSYEEIQKLFDNEMRRVNTFIPMDSEEVKSKKGTEESSKGTEDELKSDKSKKAESSEEKAKGSRKKMLGRKRARKEQQQESSKKQRMEDDKETDEVEEDDEAELKKHLVIVKDDDIAIDAIPLATKPPVIVEYKLLKEGIMVHYQLIRADGSSKRYTSMIRMLQGIDREDLETLWKLVKTKHGDIRPEDEHERVLWGDLKVMFEPNIKSDVWRSLQGYKVTIWKLYDSCGVHFVRFENDFQDSPDDEDDTRSSYEYLNGLEEEYQARALLAKSKRFFKKGTQRFSSAKATDQTECHKCGKKGYFARDCWSKALVPSYQLPFQPKPLNSSQHKPKLRPTKDFETKYNKVKAKLALLSLSASASKAMVEVKVLMALAEKNNVVSKEGSRNGEWVKISMRKVHTLLEMEDNDDRKTYLDYLGIDLNYVEEQRNNLLSKHKDLVHELNACKEQKIILGFDQLIEDPSSSGQKDLVFVKSSADDTKVSIPGVERPWLSEAEGFILPNHDTGRILPAELQRNTTNPSVTVTDSSVTEYDSADESSVGSTPLPLLKKLDGAEPISGSKTIKSV